MDAIILQLLNGLDKGSAYALIALGLTLIFGTLGVVNFAHGAMFMIGAFCAVTMQKLLNISTIRLDPEKLDFLGNPAKIKTPIVESLFGKGLGIIYAWYLDADNHIYLSMDEFRDQWRLVQRRNGADEVLRLYAADILPNTEYALALSYDAENGVIELEINGVSVCPPAISGQNQCLPQALSAGTFGFGVDNAAVSFDLIRVVRSDGPRYTEIVVDPIHADGFE